MTKPTIDQMAAYQGAFDYFNKSLFGGELPPVILNFSRSGAHTVAFYAPKRWKKDPRAKDEILDEISLSPTFLDIPMVEIMQSLVHEMCHQWQFEFGKPSLRSYHNMEWANKMLEVGLKPVNKNGGMTGQRVWDEVIEDGAFEQSFNKMPEKHAIPWRVFPKRRTVTTETESDDTGGGEGDQEPEPQPTRLKFTCPSCKNNAWGKPTLRITCSDCEIPYVDSRSLKKAA